MAKQCVEKIDHGRCGGINTLQVFLQDDDSVDGYCFKCGTPVKDPYGGAPPPAVKRKTKEEREAEIREIANYQVVDLPDRALKAGALAYFGIKIGMSGQDGVTPETYYFPYKNGFDLMAYKVGVLKKDEDGKKRMWSKGDMKDVDLFGWEQALATGQRRLYITEGEFDAVAFFQIYMRSQAGTQYADQKPAVVSLPHGIGHADRAVARNMAAITKNFDSVVLMFDEDEPGHAGRDSVLAIAPDFLTVDLPAHDLNDCLVQGHIKSVFNKAMWQASEQKNSRLVSGNDVHEAAKEPAKEGVSWPWKRVTTATRGIRTGETIYIGAAQKMGKSELVNAIGSHLIKEHDWPILLAKPEEANKKSYKLMAGKVVGRVFHDPYVPFDMDAYEEAGKALDGKLFMLDLYQHLGWESFKADVTYAAKFHGVKAVFLDPITNLTNGVNAADANTKLQEIAQELAAMAMDLDIVIFIFCHLRNPDGGGKAHDRGGKVLTGQFAGSRAMGRSCNYMFGLEGNKDPELTEAERNVRTLVLLDDREFGEVGEFPLHWDRDTTLFTER